ncbi:MAG: sulfite exporter TauE/SafE family protein [Oscillospiraceae bacterium]|nr:sulfite exporter TauE/SafE family protein [Oscillospiraceae bacterium]
MALMIIAVFCAYFAKGIAGFGNTLIFNSILSFQRTVRDITPVDFIIAAPTNLFFAVKERKNISLKIVIPLALVVYIGIIPGTFFLKFGNDRPLKVFLGALVILLAAEMFFRLKQERKAKPNKGFLAVIGIVSGVLCGIFGIGAFMAAYIARTTENQNQFRGNLCCVFVLENIFRCPVYVIAGIFTWEIIKLSLMLLPIMAIGFLLGVAVSSRINDKISRYIIVILLIVSGSTLIVKNLMQ